MIHVLINFFLLPMKFINLLIMIMKSELFLSISEVFDTVWHKGFLYKLRPNGISGNILSTIIDFLRFRKKQAALNEQVSQWTNIKAGVPQWSILATIIFE